jgi:predicted phosphoribosyltransferase
LNIRQVPCASIVAARWIRNQISKPKKLIIALPVANRDTAMLLEKEYDTLEMTKPSAGFHSVAILSRF